MLTVSPEVVTEIEFRRRKPIPKFLAIRKVDIMHRTSRVTQLLEAGDLAGAKSYLLSKPKECIQAKIRCEITYPDIEIQPEHLRLFMSVGYVPDTAVILMFLYDDKYEHLDAMIQCGWSPPAKLEGMITRNYESCCQEKPHREHRYRRRRDRRLEWYRRSVAIKG